MLKTLPPFRGAGFTLVELMIGIAILAIVMAIGMPSYSTWIQNTRLRNAAESILHGLNLARSEAVMRNTQVQFSLGAGSSWTVGCVAASDDCPDVIQSRASGDGSSSAITVAATAGTDVIFSSLGRAAVNTFNVDIDPAALSAEQSRDLRITINAGGIVRMCDPNVEQPNARAC